MATFREEADDKVWKAISDRKRRAIIDSLVYGPKLTGEIVDLFPAAARTGVMKHIGILENANLITVRRAGRLRWNHLNSKPIQQVYTRWVSKHVEGVTASAARLKKLSETRE